MNREQVVNEYWVDRYIQGSLSPEQAEEFETYYLHCDETIADLEAARVLQQSLKIIAADERKGSNGRDEDEDEDEDKKRSTWIDWFFSPQLPPALALGILVAALLPAILVLSPQRPTGDGAIANIPIATLPQVRGETEAVLNIPASGSERIVLLLELGFPAQDNYRVTAQDSGSGEARFTLDQVVPTADGDLVIEVPVAELLGSETVIAVSTGSDSGAGQPVTSWVVLLTD